MIFLLILLFLGEVTGATFFHQYETKIQTPICNTSARGSKAAWWFGKDKSSLQIFQWRCCNEGGNLRHDSQNDDCEDCPEELQFADFHGGGIFACKTLTEHPIPKNKTPIFTWKDDCKDFNFFIVATINNKTKQSSKNIRLPSEKKLPVEEKENISLSCAFELEEYTTTFAVYWFKETKPSTCLFSASNEGLSIFREVHEDINCCIDDAFKERRISHITHSGLEGRNQSHIITITNSTMADSGIYFCVVAAYSKKYKWTIESRISVSVKQLSSKIELKIFLGVVAAMLLIGVVIFLICWKKNAKGKPLECQQRDQITVAPEDCSPYAISTSKDLDRNETVYSLATSPGESPSAACFLPESKPTPGVQHGENVQALYSRVLKDRTSSHLASDVGLPST